MATTSATVKPIKTNEPKIAKNDILGEKTQQQQQTILPLVSSLNARGDRALRGRTFEQDAATGDGTSTSTTEKRKAPNWSRFVGTKGDFLTKADQDVLSQYEKQPNDSVQELLDTENNGEQYALTMFKALRNITETKVTEYVLELMEDFLAPDLSGRIVYFENEKGKLPDLTPLIRNLESDSFYVRDKSSSLLALFLSLHCEDELDSLNAYLTWSCEQLRHHKSNSNHSSLRAAVFSLTVALTHPICRIEFQKHSGVKLMQVYLQNSQSKNTQLIYEVTLCLWLCSLTPECVVDIGYQCVLDLCQLIADNRKEKIVRVALSTLRTVVLTQPNRMKELGEWLSAADLSRTLEQLHLARISDPDIVNDVEALRQALQNNLRDMTSFEIYRHEVHSGKLKWGIAHEEKFWRENARETEKDDFQCIRDLVVLLDKPKEDPEDMTLAIACSDLGYFSQFYPNGKALLATLGAKAKVMGLLEHRDRDVQKAALVCVSKMLVTQWEFLNMSS
jgi:V-type H+-transporting ATPase subunit H